MCTRMRCMMMRAGRGAHPPCEQRMWRVHFFFHTISLFRSKHMRPDGSTVHARYGKIWIIYIDCCSSSSKIIRTNDGGKIGAFDWFTTKDVLWCLCTGVKVKAASTRNLSKKEGALTRRAAIGRDASLGAASSAGGFEPKRLPPSVKWLIIAQVLRWEPRGILVCYFSFFTSTAILILLTSSQSKSLFIFIQSLCTCILM